MPSFINEDTSFGLPVIAGGLFNFGSGTMAIPSGQLFTTDQRLIAGSLVELIGEITTEPHRRTLAVASGLGTVYRISF